MERGCRRSGLAAKAATQGTASTSNDQNADCVAFTRQELDEAFVLDVRVVVTIADSRHVAEDAQDDSLLAIAYRRHGGKPH
jgi:hypothetical protein